MVCNPITAARKRLGISREQLGEMLGVSGRAVSYWEAWRKAPDEKRAKDIQRILSLSDTDLWRAMHRAADRVKITSQGKRGRIW